MSEDLTTVLERHRDVLVAMGSKSDWPTMVHACDVLDELQVSYLAMIISAHRTPDRLHTVAAAAEAAGFNVIIAGAGGAAHLPGMLASACTVLPVLGVPIQTKALGGQDSLLSIVQMPRGVPVGTLAIGEAGAVNAAHLAVQILGRSNSDLLARYRALREQQTASVPLYPQR